MISTKAKPRGNGRLTARELEVLALAAQGLNGLEIARRHRVKYSTVRTQLKKIYRKMGVHKRAAAVVKAWKRGMVEDRKQSESAMLVSMKNGNRRASMRTRLRQTGRKEDQPGKNAVICPHCGGDMHLPSRSYETGGVLRYGRRITGAKPVGGRSMHKLKTC